MPSIIYPRPSLAMQMFDFDVIRQQQLRQLEVTLLENATDECGRYEVNVLDPDVCDARIIATGDDLQQITQQYEQIIEQIAQMVLLPHQMVLELGITECECWWSFHYYDRDSNHLVEPDNIPPQMLTYCKLKYG